MRLHDQTVCCVFRVSKNQKAFLSSLVNIYVLGNKDSKQTFEHQVIDLKHIIAMYNPREVVIDCNGNGIAVADEMIKTHVDSQGIILPAYGFFNNADYRAIQPKDAPAILYSMKANGPLNSKIHSNAYTRLSNGLVRFLTTEQDARAALLATHAGQKMTFEDRIKRIAPHEVTTKLFQEMSNLRIKQTGLDVILEKINARYPKDKFSAFEYGLWRIKELEDEEAQKIQRKRILNRQLVFFSEGE